MTGGKAPAFRTLAWAHLRTGVERAVFAVVAGGAGHWWTAAAARAAGVGELDADHNLRRFEAAGIVEQQAGRSGRRYRYSNEMDLQADSDVDQELRDPICGMPVAVDTPHVAEDRGRVVRFCSIPCLTRWQRTQRGDRRP